MIKLEEKYFGIFDFRFRFGDTANSVQWVRAQISMLEQQFKSHSGHKFFFFLNTYYPVAAFGQFFYLVCRYLEELHTK